MMVVVLLVMVGYAVVLMRTQLVNGEQYEEQAIQYTATSYSITAARGEIVDHYGRAIAQNRMGYTVLFNRSDLPKGQENEIIWQLTQIMREANEEWIDECPIIISPSGYASFVEGEERAVEKMKATLNLQTYATAQNCLDTMKTEYEVGNLDSETARIIMGVRLNMEQMDFSSANPYTFAEDVSLETVQKILENSTILKGVEVEVEPIREYADGTIAPHLIGNTGPIYAEEYEELKKQGCDVTVLPFDSDGFVSPEAVEAAIRPDTVLVSIMAANNEIGTIEPIAELAAAAKAKAVRQVQMNQLIFLSGTAALLLKKSRLKLKAQVLLLR